MGRVRGLAWVGAWLVSRGAPVCRLLPAQSWVPGDLHYFADSLAQVHQVGLGQTLTEYPLPAVAVVAVPWLLARAGGDGGAYDGLMISAAVLTDAAFTVLLARSGARRRPAALLVWVAGVPLLGTTAYA